MSKHTAILSSARCLQPRYFMTSATLAQQQQQQQCPAGAGREENVSVKSLKKYSDMPGPKPLPMLGNTWRFVPGIGQYSMRDFGDTCRKLNENYGDIVRVERILSVPDAVYAFDPNDIEKIYKIESHMPERAIINTVDYYRRNVRKDIYKDHGGLANTNGPEWYKMRVKVNPVMMQPRVVKLYVTAVEEIAKEFIQQVRTLRNNDNKLPCDFLKEANKWSLESICFVAMDTRLNCFSGDSSSKTKQMIDATEEIFTLLFDLEFNWSIWRYVSTPKFRKMMKALDVQFTIGKEFLDDAIRKLEENKKNNPNVDREPSILEKLLEIDHSTAIVMAMDMMLAGVDTTSNALASILYQLSINKSKQEILREEIYKILPHESSKLTDKNLDQMPYLKACVKEAGRIFPIAPAGLRVLTSDTELSGYMLSKGMAVFFPMMYLSRSEKHYARPDEFIPERWLREDGDAELSYKKSHPFTFVPFGFGARSCIGRRIAELELEVALIYFIRNFDISWKGPPPEIFTAAVNYLKGFHFVFEDVKRKQD